MGSRPTGNRPEPLPSVGGHPLGVPIPGSSLAILTSLIPVSAFANFGTLELGWVLGFGTLDVLHDLALATGLGPHAVQLVHFVSLGPISHAFLASQRNP